MAKPEWTQLSEAFGEFGEVLTIFTTTADANSKYAERLLLDPLPLLVRNIPAVNRDWSVFVQRVNGEEAMGQFKPPRKALVTWIVIPSLSQVHGVLYRLPPDSTAS